MNVVIPVARDRGLDTCVHPHFGSAPKFLIADSETRRTRVVANEACDHGHGHGHGHCHPLAGLSNERVDAIVVGGIGPGALRQIHRANIPVYWAPQATVGELIDALARGTLDPVPFDARAEQGVGCSGHGHGHRHGDRGGQAHDLLSAIGGPHRHRHRGET